MVQNPPFLKEFEEQKKKFSLQEVINLMEVDEWAFRFLEGFRFQSEKLKKEDT